MDHEKKKQTGFIHILLGQYDSEVICNYMKIRLELGVVKI